MEIRFSHVRDRSTPTARISVSSCFIYHLASLLIYVYTDLIITISISVTRSTSLSRYLSTIVRPLYSRRVLFRRHLLRVCLLSRLLNRYKCNKNLFTIRSCHTTCFNGSFRIRITIVGVMLNVNVWRLRSSG